VLILVMIGARAQDGGQHLKGGHKRVKKPVFELKTDMGGMPVLLDITKTKLKEKKAIVRSFLTSHYSEAVIATSEHFLN
jgi:hypothetical protein